VWCCGSFRGAGDGAICSAGERVVATGGDVSPTSEGMGGGVSPPSRAGSDAMPAIAATTIAATRPTLAHLICLPATSG
jgi:hypothetical protein